MLDIKFIRENPEVVKENIKKKFQDEKLPLVDQVIELDRRNRDAMTEANNLRSERNKLSKQVGMLMGQAKKDPSKLEKAEAAKAQVKANADRLAELEKLEGELAAEIRKIMLTIPNIIDPSVPIGKDDSENVEVEKFGEPIVPEFDIPYHTDIMERFDGVDMDAAGRVSGAGFYYLMGGYRPAPRGGAGLRPGLHDRKGLHLLRAPLHDPRQRGGGRHVPDRHGRHDVQDRGGGPVPHRHLRALHDRQVHRPDHPRG